MHPLVLPRGGGACLLTSGLCLLMRKASNLYNVGKEDAGHDD